MDHDIRPSSANGAGQRGCVEGVDDHGLDAGSAERIRFGCRAGRSDDIVPGGE